jgi:hypothetical protein
VGNVKITLSCTADPGLARIDNLGSTAIKIQMTTTLYAPTTAEPYTVNRTLGAGNKVIFRSGSGATSGTILTRNYLYANSVYELDGAKIVTDGGTFTKKCPPPPSKLSNSLTCSSNPELTKITNIGLRSVTLVSIGSIYRPRSSEPYAVSRTLSPGQSITYQTGSAATRNKLTGSFIYSYDVGTAEGVYVKISNGKVFSKRCKFLLYALSAASGFGSGRGRAPVLGPRRAGCATCAQSRTRGQRPFRTSHRCAGRVPGRGAPSRLTPSRSWSTPFWVAITSVVGVSPVVGSGRGRPHPPQPPARRS